MAVLVVDRLEIVEVDDAKCKAGARVGRLGDGVPNRSVESTTVCHTGQNVLEGELLHLELELLVGGDVLREGHDTRDAAVRSQKRGEGRAIPTFAI